MSVGTLNKCLQEAIERSPDKGIGVVESQEVYTELSYKKLDEQARQWLLFMRERGLRPGDEVVFQIANTKEFLVAFWACLYGGLIPVPLALGTTDDTRRKLVKVWPVLNNPYLLAGTEEMARIRQFLKEIGAESQQAEIESRSILTEEVVTGDLATDLHPVAPDDIAYIQFSSGSTGTPKGVSLTHRNLITNVLSIHDAIDSPAEGDLCYSWMPLTHDMGLIGFHLVPVIAAWQHYFMPTELFIRNPSLWLQKIDQFRITLTSSPNFGYRFVLNHFRPANYPDLDLSSLRMIINGAEPISASLCREFTDYFAPFGLSRNAILPVYGLAEASLAVCFSQLDKETEALRLDRHHITIGESIRLSTNQEDTEFVNVGTPVRDTSVKICFEGKEQDAGQIGEVWIKGDNVTRGYYNNPEASAAVIDAAGWLNTGDLGFVWEGNFYITGRAKDIIIVNGQNYYPHDIERVAETLDYVDLGKIVFNSYFDQEAAQEQVLAYLLYRADIRKFPALASGIKSIVRQQTGVSVSQVIPVKRIPKTTSGKVQRYQLLQQYLKGEFDEVLHQLVLLQNNAEEQLTAPVNDLEEQLLQIMKEVLSFKHIGTEHHFLASGGDSLKAGAFSRRIATDLSFEVSLKDLFDYPTVKELAAYLESAQKQVLPAYPESADTNALPLANAQRRLWYLWKSSPDSLAYHVPLSLVLRGALDKARFQKAIAALVARHAVLRTVYSHSGDALMQTVLDTWEPEIQWLANADENAAAQILPFQLDKPSFQVLVQSRGPLVHEVILAFHHSLVDGTSALLLGNELLDTYAGREVKTGTGSNSFHSLAQWEERIAEHSVYQEAKEYWLSQQLAAVPALQLSTDHSRPALFDYHGARTSFRLSKHLAEAARKYAWENKTTLSNLLLAVYAMVLRKYSQHEDFIIGMSSAGRTHPAQEGASGMFVNSLPLLVQTEASMAFPALLSQVSQRVINALGHQLYPFGDLLQALKMEKDPSRNALFDTMFTYQNMGQLTAESGGLEVDLQPCDLGIAKFDLSLEVWEEPGTLSLHWEYATSLWHQNSIAQINQYFIESLQQIMDHPQASVVSPPVSEARKIQFTEQSWGEKKHYEPETLASVLKSIIQTATKHPAVDCGGVHTSYQQLNTLANALAEAMLQSGIVSGDHVAVMCKQELELMVALVAIWKTGAVFVPVDPSYPDQRKSYILQDSNARTLLYSGSVAKDLPADNAVSKQLIDLTQHSDSDIWTTISTDATAYMIYTSGTTGQPKGVQVSHQNALHYLRWASGTYLQGKAGNFACFTSIAFDLTITSMLLPALTGGTVCMYAAEDPAVAIKKILEEDKVDVIKLTPSHLQLIKAVKWSDTLARQQLKGLVLGGEALPRTLCEEIHQFFNKSVSIYNEYGPTEATVGCMIYEYNPEQDDQETVPIGKAIENTAIYLLDEQLTPVPQGASGEIYISGSGVAKGYYQKEELTASRFLPDPFVKGCRMYKSGDLARINGQGEIQYLGRIDNQIKYKGYRIELGEVSHHIADISGVEQCVANLLEHNSNKVLCAWYVGSPDHLAIRYSLEQQVPQYLIPAYIMQIAEMPLTSNGKADMSALPLPFGESQEADYIAPESALEVLLTQVIASQLGLEKVGMQDSFYALGGDSIKAVQISNQLKREGYDLAVKDILVHKKPAAILPYITTLQIQDSETMLEGSRDFSPVECWFMEQYGPEANYYHQSVVLELHQQQTAGRVAEAMTKLVDHYDSLRQNLSADAMIYNPRHQGKAFNLVQSQIEAGQDILAQLRNLAGKMKTGWDLQNDLLIKVNLAETAVGKQYLIITAHHLIVDGITWRLLLEDLRNLLISPDATLALKSASVNQWVSTLKKMSMEISDDERKYWHEVAESTFSLPANASIGTEGCTIASRSEQQFELDTDYTQQLLTEANKNYSTTPEILIATALCLALEGWTGQKDLRINWESHGRNLEAIDINNTAGWFTTLYPIRIQLNSDSLSDKLIAVKDQVKSVPSHGLGYSLLRYYAQDEALSEVKDLIRFNYLGRVDQEGNNELFSLMHNAAGPEQGDNNPLTTKIEINAIIQSGKLYITIASHREEFKQTTIEGFGLDIIYQLRQLIDHVIQTEDQVFTSSDFEGISLDTSDLDSLFD